MGRRHRAALTGLAGGFTALALTACSGGGGDFCSTLTENTAASATIFSPPVMQLGDVDAIQDRIDTLEQIESPPEEVADDLDTWVAHLETIRDTWETDPDDAEVVLSDPEADLAGSTLSAYYTGTCL